MLQMQTLRSRLSWVLLLCFMRVLLPEAWALELHAHQHTTEEPSISGPLRGKAALSVQHQHCAVDHFYDVPFQPAPPLVLPAALFAYASACVAVGADVWQGRTAVTAHLRGPPSQS